MSQTSLEIIIWGLLTVAMVLYAISCRIQKAQIAHLREQAEGWRTACLEAQRWFASDLGIASVLEWVEEEATGEASDGYHPFIQELRRQVQQEREVFQRRWKNDSMLPLSADDLCELRTRWREGMDFDEYMAIAVNARVKGLTLMAEYADQGAEFPTRMTRLFVEGEQVWPPVNTANEGGAR